MQNEEEVGKAIKESGVSRKDLWLTSKLWNTFHAGKDVLPICKKQLADWGLEYFDLYLVHSPLSGKEKRLETYASLLKKRDEGKIRSVGVSN